MKLVATGLACIAALAFSASAQAAPIGPSVEIKAGASGLVENVAYRRCWYEDGDRFCRTYYRADDDYYGGGYSGFYGVPFPIFGGWGGGHYGGGHFRGHSGHGGGHGRR